MIWLLTNLASVIGNNSKNDLDDEYRNQEQTVSITRNINSFQSTMNQVLVPSNDDTLNDLNLLETPGR